MGTAARARAKAAVLAAALVGGVAEKEAVANSRPRVLAGMEVGCLAGGERVAATRVAVRERPTAAVETAAALRAARTEDSKEAVMVGVARALHAARRRLQRAQRAQSSHQAM